MDLYEIMEQYFRSGHKGALATVLRKSGSAPRDAGTRMFVGDDGKCHGTLGGGLLEFDVYKEAINMMKTNEAKILQIRMNSKEIAEEGMLCGGDVDILLEPVDEKNIRIYSRVGQLLRKREKGVVVTWFKGNAVSKTLVEEDGGLTGDFLKDEEIKKYSEYIKENHTEVIEGVVIEPLRVFSLLYIFGAGHVSQFICRFASIVDFYVVVIDDREEFANRERFPEANQIIVEDFHNVFKKLKFTGKEFVAIVTRGHKYDADVLMESLKKTLKYIGMIGSKRKIEIIFDYIRKNGFSEEAIGRVHAPIGLAISAETPQEIAVSIVAELIKIRGEI